MHLPCWAVPLAGQAPWRQPWPRTSCSPLAPYSTCRSSPWRSDTATTCRAEEKRPVTLAPGIRGSVLVTGELKRCLFFPLLCCRPKGILSGGICGILFGSSFWAVYGSMGKSCWIFLGPSYSWCLSVFSSGDWNVLLSKLCWIGYASETGQIYLPIASHLEQSVKLMQCKLQMLFPYGVPCLLDLLTHCTWKMTMESMRQREFVLLEINFYKL